uniref:Polyprotein n=1 Tax=Anisakis simplex TaxID=6269 RepID=A0A0M3KKN0_ANISI
LLSNTVVGVRPITNLSFPNWSQSLRWWRWPIRGQLIHNWTG